MTSGLSHLTCGRQHAPGTDCPPSPLLPRRGERWRIDKTLSKAGVVLEVYPNGGGVLLRDENGTRWSLSTRDGWAPAERLPDPEPEWQVGELVLDANGAAWRRRENGWWLMGMEGEHPHHVPARPLRRLVIEGGA